jgi:nucleoside-diphosphate-sugar epimerase
MTKRPEPAAGAATVTDIVDPLSAHAGDADDHGVRGGSITPDCELGNCRSRRAGASRLLLVSTTNGDVVKILIAGASGAIGSQLVAQLVARGHEVVGTTRSAAKTDALRALGAEPVILDALDPDSVADVVAKAEPEVIVHQATALNGPINMRNVKRMAVATNRLRSEGTDHLVAAGRAVGVRKVVAQSNYAILERTGGPVVDENAPIEPNPPKDVKEAVDALRHLEDVVKGITWADGIALRYGGFYGPGTGIETAPDAVTAGLIRRRRFPIVGGGGGMWSMMTSRRRCAKCCWSWPACSAPNRRAACRPG